MATTPDPQNPDCVFSGGTHHGKREKRMMFGYVTSTILVPVYEPDKHGNCNRKDITHRQTYVRDRRFDDQGALGYVLDKIEKVA